MPSLHGEPAGKPLIRRYGDLLGPVEEHFEEMFDETAEERCANLRIRVIIQNIRVQLIEDAICRTSPLIVDLDGDGAALSAPPDGVAFDLHATGEPAQRQHDATSKLLRDPRRRGRDDRRRLPPVSAPPLRAVMDA